MFDLKSRFRNLFSARKPKNPSEEEEEVAATLSPDSETDTKNESVTVDKTDKNHTTAVTEDQNLKSPAVLLPLKDESLALVDKVRIEESITSNLVNEQKKGIEDSSADERAFPPVEVSKTSKEEPVVFQLDNTTCPEKKAEDEQEGISLETVLPLSSDGKTSHPTDHESVPTEEPSEITNDSKNAIIGSPTPVPEIPVTIEEEPYPSVKDGKTLDSDISGSTEESTVPESSNKATEQRPEAKEISKEDVSRTEITSNISENLTPTNISPLSVEGAAATNDKAAKVAELSRDSLSEINPTANNQISGLVDNSADSTEGTSIVEERSGGDAPFIEKNLLLKPLDVANEETLLTDTAKELPLKPNEVEVLLNEATPHANWNIEPSTEENKEPIELRQETSDEQDQISDKLAGVNEKSAEAKPEQAMESEEQIEASRPPAKVSEQSAAAREETAEVNEARSEALEEPAAVTELLDTMSQEVMEVIEEPAEVNENPVTISEKSIETRRETVEEHAQASQASIEEAISVGQEPFKANEDSSQAKEELAEKNEEKFQVSEKAVASSSEPTGTNEKLAETNEEPTETNEESTEASKEPSEANEDSSKVKGELAEENKEQFQVSEKAVASSSEPTGTNEKLAEKNEEPTETNEVLAERSQELTETNEKSTEASDESPEASMQKAASVDQELVVANEKQVQVSEKAVAPSSEPSQTNEKIAETSEELFEANENSSKVNEELAEKNEKRVQVSEKVAEPSSEHTKINEELVEACEQSTEVSIQETTSEDQELVGANEDPVQVIENIVTQSKESSATPAEVSEEHTGTSEEPLQASEELSESAEQAPEASEIPVKVSERETAQSQEPAEAKSSYISEIDQIPTETPGAIGDSQGSDLEVSMAEEGNIQARAAEREISVLKENEANEENFSADSLGSTTQVTSAPATEPKSTELQEKLPLEILSQSYKVIDSSEGEAKILSSAVEIPVSSFNKTSASVEKSTESTVEAHGDTSKLAESVTAPIYFDQETTPNTNEMNGLTSFSEVATHGAKGIIAEPSKENLKTSKVVSEKEANANPITGATLPTGEQ